MTVEKPKPKQLLRPITTGAGSAMNQSQFLAITCNSPEAREKSPVHGAIGFGFASHWLKNWRDSFKPISKRSNRNHVITFDSHLETALRSQIAVPIETQAPSRFTKVPKLFGRILGDLTPRVIFKTKASRGTKLCTCFNFLIPFTIYEKTTFTEKASQSF